MALSLLVVTKDGSTHNGECLGSVVVHQVLLELGQSVSISFFITYDVLVFLNEAIK